MYKVAYRKYRPMRFADVVGQPQVTVTLKNELKSGRISHAYLFTGTRGTGKTTCAKILSKAVNCLNLQDGDPCGECEICRGLDSGSVLDVVEIDAASNNGVDSIRSLIEESNFTPAKTKYRVYIIDEVHMLSVAAFNALLKTLEEPPPHVIFILATTEVHKLLPTILSRCQRFDFKHIAPAEIAGRLEYVTAEENASITHDAAMLIARLADGALRDALSLLDQCLGRSEEITVSVVQDAAGMASRDYLSGFAGAVLKRDAADVMISIDTLHKASKDMSRLCEELAEYFRGLMLIKTMRNAEQLVVVSEEEFAAMTEQALALSLADILHVLDTLRDTLNKMRYSNPRVELEMAFIRLCSPELDSTPEALIRRIEALEKGSMKVLTTPVKPAPSDEGKRPNVRAVAAPSVSSDTEKPKPEEKEEGNKAAQNAPDISTEAEVLPMPDAEPVEGEFTVEQEPEADPELPGQTAFEAVVQPKVSGTVDPAALSRDAELFLQWPEILDIMKAYSNSVAVAFSGSSAYVNGGYMLIKAPQIAFDLLKRPSQRDKMRDVIRQVTGRLYKLGPYKEDEVQEQEDPLELLEQRAREAGIPVIIEENEKKEDESI